MTSASSVFAQTPPNSTVGGVSVSITDGKDRVAPGGDLIYVVTVTQNLAAQQNMDVMVTLPPFVNIVSPNNGGVIVGNTVLWSRVPFSQSEQKIFTIQVNLLPSTPENTLLTAIAQAGSAQSSDSTAVQSGIVSGAFQVSLSNPKSSALPGDTVTYTVKAKNTSAFSQHADVTVTASNLTSIQTTVPEAQVSVPRIVWQSVLFAPNQEQTFSFTAIISKRLPPYTGIVTSVKVGTVSASNSMYVQSTKKQQSSSSSSSSSSRSRASSSSAGDSKHVLFRKVADAAEVVPGGTVHYTLYVQNTLLNDIRDAVITDRFDTSLQSVVEANGAKVTGDGTLQWTLPVLQPGQIWKTSYSLKVAPNLSNGTEIRNVATISGTDVSFATLNEKVTVATTDVVGILPTTGASFDLLFLFSILPLAAVGAFAQKIFTR